MSQRGVGDLVDRQVHRWHSVQREPHTQLRRCVALSRQPHSGAGELARTVAEKLDYGLFGIEIVDRIARERGIQRQLVAELDEHVRSGIDRYVLDSFRHRSFVESDYLRHVVRTIAILGEQGMAVILGRGSPFVLGPDRALRVLVVAPLEARLERLARRTSLSDAAARDRLVLEDEQRVTFLAQFGVAPDDPTHYDLVVNAASLGLDPSARLIVDALSRTGTR
jgi:cytidylate kinase